MFENDIQLSFLLCSLTISVFQLHCVPQKSQSCILWRLLSCDHEGDPSNLSWWKSTYSYLQRLPAYPRFPFISLHPKTSNTGEGLRSGISLSSESEGLCAPRCELGISSLSRSTRSVPEKKNSACFTQDLRKYLNITLPAKTSEFTRRYHSHSAQLISHP
jgi:hypothetical protein